MMDQSETWMAWGLCRAHPDLGWVKDADHAGLRETVLMDIICSRCLVAEACEDFVTREHITGGFWVGQFRDPDHSVHDVLAPTADVVVGGVA